MKVFKFGGASVSTAERVRNVAGILQRYREEQLVVVISAMGKTTNALEKVVAAFFQGDSATALSLFAAIREEHLSFSRELMPSIASSPSFLLDFFTEVEWLLHDQPVREYDYYYDQVVCIGELLSTAIISRFLHEEDVRHTWLDVRDLIRTDNNFRDARIQWDATAQRVSQQVIPALKATGMVLTQGFIGATDDNESTTLGREGSDYTAAVFANLLDAESQTIWKDVQGVMNADPKQYAEAQWIKELNYREVIEMAYYGAQVIHPKTIKPLQNKGIPLYVRSFLHPEEEGTCIHNRAIPHLPSIIVYKHRQVLVELSSRDFSFVGEGGSALLSRLFETLKYQPNLTQNGAISLLCVVDDHPEKADALAHAASAHFDVTLTRNLTLLTIRHYAPALLDALCQGHRVILRQQTTETVQVLLETSGPAAS
jgi:aspartate kinase